jgi:uncharacterized damage-inducible protein DinB
MAKWAAGAVLDKMSAQDASELRVRKMRRCWKANEKIYHLTKYEHIWA